MANTTRCPTCNRFLGPEPCAHGGMGWYWRHVDKSGGPDACWLWTGRTQRRYGLAKSRPLREYLAHRVAWVLAHGPIPDGLQVRHDCDNPPCVNPAHLQVGTRADNDADIWARGRNVLRREPGRRGGFAKAAKMRAARELARP